jgi:hypothetical protein
MFIKPQGIEEIWARDIGSEAFAVVWDDTRECKVVKKCKIDTIKLNLHKNENFHILYTIKVDDGIFETVASGCVFYKRKNAEKYLKALRG